MVSRAWLSPCNWQCSPAHPRNGVRLLSDVTSLRAQTFIACRLSNLGYPNTLGQAILICAAQKRVTAGPRICLG